VASAPKIPGLLAEELDDLGAFRARVDAGRPADLAATEADAQDLPAWDASGYAALSGLPPGEGQGQAQPEIASETVAADAPGIDAVMDAPGGGVFLTATAPAAESEISAQAGGDGAAAPGGASDVGAVAMGEVFIDDGSFDWSGDIWTLDAESTPLIGLTTFRNDSRFTGIDGSGTSVVVIDTGINLSHTYFAGHIAYSYDFYSGNDSNATDYNGHGSNVASIAAGSTGMAPGANIIALKVFPDGGGGASYTDIEEALQWTINNAAAYNIVSVNLSLGAGENLNYVSSVPYLSNEFQSLANLGVVTVAAAGNSYASYQSQGVSWIAADPNTLAVGAVYDANTGGWSYGSGARAYSTTADQITPFSQRSTTVMDIFAPGAPILGAGAGSSTSTVTMHGTSQAAPHITGIVALAQELAVQTIGRKLTVAEFTSMLKSSGVGIYDGDNENDNVANTNAYYTRVDVNALGNALLALAEPQILDGTAGDDVLQSSEHSTQIYGYDGNDILIGGGNRDFLFGGDGSDQAFGNDGNDVLKGGAGGDYLFGNAGPDWMEGGSEGDSVVGGAGDDVIFGESGGDYLFGDDGNDYEYGGDDGDYMLGGNNEDWMQGGNGADMLYGQAGSDVLIGDAGGDYLIGDDGNDVLKGGDDGDYHLGGNGGDYVEGGNGGDMMYGGAGDDVILGGAGNDVMTGESGNDQLYGGAGDDRLYGGAGIDQFVYQVGLDLQGVDTIVDFQAGAGGDYINLDTLLGNAGYGGNDPVAAGYVTWGQAGSDTRLMFDLNGGADDFQLLIVLQDVNAGQLSLFNNLIV